MKAALVSLFLFFAFPLAFAQQVLDTNGNPIFPGREYYILPSVLAGPPGGGMKLGTTGNSKCPVTVLQDYSEAVNGIPVKFTILVGISTLQIYENTSLEIEFTKKPKCVESSKWILFFDNEIEKACVGIGDAEDHNPDDPHIFLGTFTIKRAKFGYKLAFCYESNCMDIGRFNKNGEGGRRLYLTKGEPFDVVFIESSSYNNGIGKVYVTI